MTDLERFESLKSKRGKTFDDVLFLSNYVHKNKFTYDESTFVDMHTKMRIICPIHGEFWQKPTRHIYGKHGCPDCNGGIKMTTEKFIQRAREVHGDKYDYSKTDLDNRDEKGRVIITCPIHGDFPQKPYVHLLGHGCQICGGSLPLDTNTFISRANLVHNNKYDYSKFVYVNNRAKGIIICPEHGEFPQVAEHHLNGVGCPFCKDSHLERETHISLNDLNIKHDRTAHFDWLGKQHLDFYLPEYFIAIECQGKQHFEPCTFGGISKEEAKENLIYVQELDERKSKLCKENNIFLEYINYDDNIEKRINEIIEKYNIHHG